MDDKELEKIKKSLESMYSSSDDFNTGMKSFLENILKDQQNLSEQTMFELSYLIDKIDSISKHKTEAFKEAINYSVKKTLQYFPEHSGRTTRLMEVPGHGSFIIDLDTGEFLGGKQHLYDDWVDGKIRQPEPPEPRKINPKRLAALAFPLILACGLIITSAVTFVNRNFGALEITEYRFAKPGEIGYRKP